LALLPGLVFWLAVVERICGGFGGKVKGDAIHRDVNFARCTKNRIPTNPCHVIQPAETGGYARCNVLISKLPKNGLKATDIATIGDGWIISRVCGSREFKQQYFGARSQQVTDCQGGYRFEPKDIGFLDDPRKTKTCPIAWRDRFSERLK